MYTTDSSTAPSRPRQTVALCIFVLSVLSSAHLCFTPISNPLDFPIQIISVQRILHREVPYRGFEVLYGALGHYAAAAVQWPLTFLGPVFSFEWYVFLCLIVFYAAVSIAFASGRPRNYFYSAGSALVLILSTNALARIAYYSLPMLIPIIAVIYALRLSVPSRSARHATFWQSVSGILIACEIFTRINFGIYAAVAVLLVGLAALFTRDKAVAIAALRCLAVAAVTTCVLLCLFAATGILLPAIADMRRYIPRAQTGRGVLLKYMPDKVLLVVTGLSVGTSLLCALDRFRKRAGVGFWLVPYILLCAFSSYALFRFDTMHIYPILVLLLIILVDVSGTEPLADGMDSDLRPRPRRFSTRLPELQLLTMFLLFGVAGNEIDPAHSLRPLTKYLHLHRPSVGLTVAAKALAEPTMVRNGVRISTQEAGMLDRLDGLRKPGEEIFWASAPGSCQSTFDLCANLSLYLADKTLPRQKVWIFDTPSTPYEDVQREIVAGLEGGKTPWIGMQDVYTVDTTGVSHPEAKILGEYVKDHYRVVFTTEVPNLNRKYRIYRRKDLS